MSLIIDNIPKWTLDEAISFVRELNKLANKRGYHLGIAGSVLINGESSNDLDIYAFPLHYEDSRPDERELVVLLRTLDFNIKPLENGEYNESYANIYRFYDSKNRTIDLFVIAE